MADQLISPEVLKQIGNIIRAKAIELAPQHLKDLIQMDDLVSVSPVKGQIGVAIRINMAKYPDTPSGSRESKSARALEYGNKTPYKIFPKKGAALAFFWDKVGPETGHSAKFSGISKRTGKAIFNYVDHPVTEAYNHGVGYMRPALQASKSECIRIVGKDVVDNIWEQMKTRVKFTRPGGHG